MEATTDQIDALIGKRSRMQEQTRAEEMAWKESVRRHNEKNRRANRAAWHSFHLNQAQRIERTAGELVAHHRERAELLMEEAP